MPETSPHPGTTIITIFGASGDLASRKLLPALADLHRQGVLPAGCRILGLGRTALMDDAFRAKMRTAVGDVGEDFLARLAYLPLDSADPAAYPELKSRLEALGGTGTCALNILYYLAMPPATVPTIAENLQAAGLTCEKHGGWKRVIVEKPFGRDLSSARALNATLHDCFAESQIYRIDHYLGKETVQNILVTRFANSIFEPLWNRNYVDYVEITAAESLGVGTRAGYYETAGQLRDMLQNHLLQILGIVAMEPPVTSDATSIRNEMVKVFQALRPIAPTEVSANVVRGQYMASTIRGMKHAAYREERGVAPDSKAETFVAMRCLIDNWRWSGVPFFVRTGKCLPTRVTEVVVHFKPNPHTIFSARDAAAVDKIHNQLVIRIQPDEGLLLKLGTKVPGAGFRVDTVNMDFHYADLAGNRIPEAYERLIGDCLAGDATLFQRGDAVELTWRYVQPILDAWADDASIPLYGYASGSWGPEQAEALLGAGRAWRYPCKNLANDGVACEL